MLRATFRTAIALVVVIGLVLPVLAKPIRTTITLRDPAKIVGKALDPGEYEVISTDNKLTLKQKGKVVAEVECVCKEATEKFRSTTVILDQGAIREIRFGGTTHSVVFR